MARRRWLGPRLTLAQVKALETEKMQQRTEKSIGELMADNEDSKAEPVHEDMRRISLIEFLVLYGLLWFLIVLCAAFFSALLQHPA
jgi:hypothetical protein